MALWDGEAVTQRQGGGGFSSHSSNTPPCEFRLLETQQPPRMPSSGECSGSPGRPAARRPETRAFQILGRSAIRHRAAEANITPLSLPSAPKLTRGKSF